MASPKTILLVEDNRDDELLTLRALHKNRIANPVVVARDGVEAIDYLFDGEHRAAPLVVLLDLRLPRLDGIEVLRRIRANDKTRYVPVIVLSSSNEQEDVVACYESGANAYVRKPVDYRAFHEAAMTLGRCWTVLNLAPP
jgi:two-component system response regulator